VLERSLADRGSGSATTDTGPGAGGDAALGRQAAEEDEERCGPRSRRPTSCSSPRAWAAGPAGAAPLIACTREAGALTIAVDGAVRVRGRDHDGAWRRPVAELRPNVDTLLVIENERVNDLSPTTRLAEAFRPSTTCWARRSGPSSTSWRRPASSPDFADVARSWPMAGQG
jgi:cell division GTPase FtsZ